MGLWSDGRCVGVPRLMGVPSHDRALPAYNVQCSYNVGTDISWYMYGRPLVVWVFRFMGVDDLS